MKRFFLLTVGMCLAFTTFSQIPVQWWGTLPDDFLENPWERNTVLVRQIDDAAIIGATTLESFWPHINEVFVNDITFVSNPTVDDYTTGEAVSTTLPEQDAADFSAQFAVLASATSLYFVYNVTDNEVDGPGGDQTEIVIAPYGGAYDPGRTIHPNLTDAPWLWDADSMKFKFGARYIHPDTLGMMAQYGLWGETGAVKLGAITPATDPELYAGTMYFEDNADIGDTLDIVPNFGTTTVPLMSLFEPSSTGYYYLIAIPWAIFTDFKLENEGDEMSLAVRLADYDSDNPTYVDDESNTQTHTFVRWGGGEHNDVYWAVAFYGAKAELVIPVGTSENLARDFQAYFASNMLFFEEDVATLDIYSVTGAHVRSLNQVSGSIDLSDLESGLYIATMKGSNGKAGALKFVKY